MNGGDGKQVRLDVARRGKADVLMAGQELDS
jgi:hypothetical protein